MAFGDAELPELQRQSQAFFERRQAGGKPGALLPLDGLNHFSILDALGDPQSPLVDALCQLAA